MLRAPQGANTASCSGASQARESESRRELSQPRLGLRRPTDLLQAKVQRSGKYRNMEKYAQKVSENWNIPNTILCWHSDLFPKNMPHWPSCTKSTTSLELIYFLSCGFLTGWSMTIGHGVHFDETSECRMLHIFLLVIVWWWWWWLRWWIWWWRWHRWWWCSWW